MTKLQRFIPQTPDPYLRQGDQLGAVKFGHLNALVDALNATVFGDYLQLAGDGPMSTTLRALEDPEGNIANLYLATDKTAISGSLKIGNNTSNLSSAILQIDSTSQGVLFPRMTIAERDAIVSPAIGLLVYNTEDLILNQWNGTEWTEVGGGGGLGLLDDALMTSTLTSVVDKENTASPLKLSTNLVSVGSTLQISTDDTTYIDAEDSLGNNRFTISRVVGQQEVNVDFASNPTDGATKVGAIRTYQDGVNLSDAISVEKNGQATFNERVKIEADSTATTQTTAVIEAIGTNSGVALVPNGTGAITADIPDGTAVGGNARGQYAVDLQRVRTSANSRAGGNYSVVVGGADNLSGGQYSLSGGFSNVASGQGSVSLGYDNGVSGEGAVGLGYTNRNVTGFASVAIGGFNDSTANYSVALGEGNSSSARAASVLGGRLNNVSSQYSVISGGENNTASTNAHAAVVGGSGNVSSGQYSISGGRSNVASGLQSVALGFSNVASGQGSVALGYDNNATGFQSFAFGSNSTAGSFYSGVLGYLSNATAQNSYAIGQQTNASASSSIAFMGGSSTAQGSVSFQGGLSQAVSSYSIGIASYGYLLGMNAFSNGNFGGPLKTIQHSFVLARKEAVLNALGTTILSLDGTGITNLLIPTNADSGARRFWNVTVEYVVFCLAVGSGTTVLNEMAIGTDKFLFKRPLGVSTIGTITNIHQSSEASMVGASCTYAVGASQDLQITFVAPSTANETTFRIAAKVSLVELS